MMLIGSLEAYFRVRIPRQLTPYPVPQPPLAPYQNSRLVNHGRYTT